MKKLNSHLRNTPGQNHNQNTTQQDLQDSSSELDNSAQWEQISNLLWMKAQDIISLSELSSPPTNKNAEQATESPRS